MEFTASEPQGPFVPKADMPPSAVRTAHSVVEYKQIPFVGHWTVLIDGVQVAIPVDGTDWWNWPTKEAAMQAVDTLPITE